MKNKEQHLKSGYWHGNDAWIISGNKTDGYAILVGVFTEEEATEVKTLLENEDPQVEEYNDYIVYAEHDEWEEQQ